MSSTSDDRHRPATAGAHAEPEVEAGGVATRRSRWRIWRVAGSPHRVPLSAAVAVLVAGVAISVGLAAFLRADLVSSAKTHFVDVAADTNSATASNLKRYGDLMVATSAYIANKPALDYASGRVEFLGYAGSLQLPTRYRGAYGLGFMARIPTTEAPALNAAMKTAGQPGFDFTPSSRPYACPIEFLEWATQAGFPTSYARTDFCSTNLISVQMDESISTGRQVIFPMVSFANGPNHTYDFAMFKPVFAAGQPVDTPAQRAQSLTGWVVGLFQGQPIAAAVNPEPNHVGVQLYAGARAAPAGLVVARPSGSAQRAAETRESHIDADGPWVLRVTNLGVNAGSVGLVAPLAVLAAGVALSLALFGILQVLRHAESHARLLVEETTASLRQSEQRFRSFAVSSPAGIVQVDLHGSCLYANGRMGEITGRPPESLEGQGWLAAIHPADREEFVAKLRPVLGRQDHLSAEMRVLAPNGDVHWTRMRAASLKAASGAILSYVVTVEDVTRLVQSNRHMRYQALHDPLTGLANRTLFLDRLGNALRRMERRGTVLAVLFLDLDRFKVVNDSLGHQRGDELLVAVATRIQAGLRTSDTLARLGGDEFTILTDGISGLDDAVRIADRVNFALQESFTLSSNETFVTASIGIVVVSEPTDDAESLLSNADAAMYLAKQQGRARYEIFNADLGEQATPGPRTGRRRPGESDAWPPAGPDGHQPAPTSQQVEPTQA